MLFVRSALANGMEMEIYMTMCSASFGLPLISLHFDNSGRPETAGAKRERWAI
jgi:hypothetical protein